MPQMKPMNWFYLLFYSLFVYMIMNSILYFFNYKYIYFSHMNLKKNYKNFNLKW